MLIFYIYFLKITQSWKVKKVLMLHVGYALAEAFLYWLQTMVSSWVNRLKIQSKLIFIMNHIKNY